MPSYWVSLPVDLKITGIKNWRESWLTWTTPFPAASVLTFFTLTPLPLGATHALGRLGAGRPL